MSPVPTPTGGSLSATPSDPSARDGGDRRETRYLAGSGLACVTADSVLLVSRRVGDDDPVRLHARVVAATDARSVLAAAAGGRVLDLDALPDLAFAYRNPAGVRVVLSGRTRCTVVDGAQITHLDGSEVALLGEWGFPGSVSVELAHHDSADGEATWPVTGGVVLADRIAWAPAARGEEPVVRAEPVAQIPVEPSAQTPAEPVAQTPVEPVAQTPVEPPVAPVRTAPTPADATLLPEDSLPESPAGDEDHRASTADPAVMPEAESALGPDVAPVADADAGSAGDDGDWEDGLVEDVDYTIGGGIDYDRVLNRNRRPKDPAPTTPPAPTTTPGPTPSAAPTVAETATQSAAPTTGTAAAAVAGPAPSPAYVAEPDLGGDTVPPATAAALREEAATGGVAGSEVPAAGDAEAGEQSADEPAGTTSARLCPQNHANPPHLSECRVCSAPLDGPTLRVTRPSLGVVRLSTGMFFDLDRPLLIGREPRLDGADADSAPRLIVLPSPDKAISRSHLRVDIDGWTVHAVDLGGVNGTYLRRGTAEEVRLMPDEPKMLAAGDVLVVDDIRIRFEDLP